ncbi:MAG TPA: hypothetical protein VH988_34745 [Thermoanaerobaculia bacterium]|jgi:hypothetical protein|nr:hypothetical protein [Thermoanaerobaculia bacterium]
MKPLDDDDLILYLYGESADPEAVRLQIEFSAELRARCESLRRVLAAVDDAVPVPERGEGYGAEVWARLAPRLARAGREGRRLSFPVRPRRPASGWAGWTRWAAAALVLIAVGFGLGRLWPRPTALPQQARDRILLATVAAHLDRSERLLAEVAHTPDASDGADLSAERAWARDLLAANRLYRQSTRQAGRQRLAGLLDELEPVLLDLAHASDELPAAELAALRERIANQSLLFKVRVASDHLENPKQTL